MEWKCFPKNREGLIALIVDFLSRVETTYISFCKELDHSSDGELMNYFCDNKCEIHQKHVSHQLLCLPLSCQNFLKKRR